MTKREQRVINAFCNCVRNGEFTEDYAITLIEDNQRYGWLSNEAKDEFYGFLDDLAVVDEEPVNNDIALQDEPVAEEPAEEEPTKESTEEELTEEPNEEPVEEPTEEVTEEQTEEPANEPAAEETDPGAEETEPEVIEPVETEEVQEENTAAEG